MTTLLRLASMLSMAGLAACVVQTTGGRPPTDPSTGTPTPTDPQGEPPAPTPPVAAMRPYEVKAPAGTRNDPYYWLRDDRRQNPEMLAYLNAENAYSAAVMAPHKTLEDTLFAEMRGRIKEDDSSVPTLDRGYWYYSRFEAGQQHPIFARRKGTMAAPEEILLDGNQLAVGHAFYTIGNFEVSANGSLLVWGDDTEGRNKFTMHVKDLRTGQLLPDTAANISPNFAWSSDNKTLYYVGKDPVTLRTDRVFRLTLGGQPEQIYKEDDGQYYVSLSTSKSRRFIMINASATTNSEVRLIEADRPRSAPKVFLARSANHLYQVEHLGGRFYVRSNDGAQNFRLLQIELGQVYNRKNWKELIPHNPDMLVEDFAVYNDFIAVTVRTAGLRKIRVLPKTGPAFFLDAPDPTYAMTVLDTPEAASTTIRYQYDAMATPRSVFEYEVASKQSRLLKQQPVPGYDPSLYTSEYLHATASDGAQIPISVVYKKSTARDGSAPLLVYGYGSYGFSMEPRFDSTVVSMLDRGWVYAIAHVRGGQELGRAWYETGKLMNKMNTFTDFISASEHLVAQRYGARGRVFAMGASAGGLLMGAVANLRPDLYRGIAALVPFVDVVTTMLDESIPLTTNEFDEWGNPKNKDAYDYMLSYSPYDNVKAAAYPAIYVRTGLHDSQVQYFEPAKWVAKLRATKTDKNPLVFDIDMTAGHGGASGRFDRLRQTARTLTFFLMVNGQKDPRS
ncbi:MAG: S9 family peptidase [Kofleriaceae bacterium]